MRNMAENELTGVVLERYASTPDERLRTILQSLIRHLHDFVRDVRLTEAEWVKGIEFLTATGQMSDDKRQEMILLSDNLGISALVNLASANVPEGATETTVLGPFYVPNSPPREWGQSVLLHSSDDPSLLIHGTVRAEDGSAIPRAKIEIWQTDVNGMYDIQDPDQPPSNLRGTYVANERGEFLLHTIKPTLYPIPTDGPVGALLRATKRHPYRPAHVHAMVTAPGFKPLVTHLFDADDGYLDSDVVFAVKASLIRSFLRSESVEDAKRFGVKAPFFELANDFVLTSAA